MDVQKPLPWWRKDVYGWPIETYRGRPIKSIIRIICQNIRKLWGKPEPYSRYQVPIIKKAFPKFDAAEFVSIQSMKLPAGVVFYTELLDVANPRVGQIFSDVPKGECNAPLCCCLQEYWHKIWTPDGWVYEKDAPVAYQQAVDTYNGAYNEQVKKERAEFEKNNPPDTPPHLPLRIVYDSNKQQG